MKSFLEEYGRTVVLGILAALCLVMLLARGAILDTIDQVKPHNPEVRNDMTKLQLVKLQDRAKPRLKFQDPGLRVGGSIAISDLVAEAADAEGSDLKSQVEYYLEDGTKVSADYRITGEIPTTKPFHFYVQDGQGLYTEARFAIMVGGSGGMDMEAQLEAEWDIGIMPDTVKARVYSYPGAGHSPEYTILISGSGKTRSFTPDTVPWDRYKDVLEECRIGDSVEAEDVSYWFKDCKELIRVPELKGAKTLEETYAGCVKLKSAGIPKSAVNINGIYKGCTGITAASGVPPSVLWMKEAFYGCENLRGELSMSAYPYEYTNCFYKVASQTRGVSLKVYSQGGNENIVKQMVLEEIFKDNGSNVVFIRKEHGV